MLEVKCYSGYKGEEKPLKFILDNQEYFVESILRKELIEDYKTHERKTVFWCQTKDKVYKLTKHSTGEWQIAEKPARIKETQTGIKITENTEYTKRKKL